MCDMVQRQKNGFRKQSENLSNKAKIYGSLAPGAKGFQGPSNSPSSILLAPIARRLPDGHKNVSYAALHDLQMVFINDRKEHS